LRGITLAVRNGVEWTKDLPVYGDICVLYYDGTMETYAKKSVNSALVAEILREEPYQIWTFGPQLLIDGQVPSSFERSAPNPSPPWDTRKLGITTSSSWTGGKRAIPGHVAGRPRAGVYTLAARSPLTSTAATPP
jgi:hypothetical protein